MGLVVCTNPDGAEVGFLEVDEEAGDEDGCEAVYQRWTGWIVVSFLE